jgi:2-dehydro-3-deoxy-L-rhamnonate dehydrogenase (NAD+)
LHMECMKQLQDRVAIITGGARGIGRAVAERLIASGVRVSLWDRDADALARTAAELRAHHRVLDLTDAGAVDAAAAATRAHHGRVDILVNNAGIAGVTKKLWEFTPEEWRAVIEVNLNAVFLCCRAVAPLMLAGGWGRIVNVASIAGKEGNPNASHYSASKAGVIGLTKSLGKELAQSGIIVNCVTPAVIETDYMRSKIPMNRFGKKEEAAALIAWLCSEECSFSTGAVFDLSGGRATY